MVGYGKKTDRRLIIASRLAGFVLVGLCALFTTCNLPMGLGDSIDWDPPLLTMDPGPNPRYVRLGTKLTGSVTDNIAVDKVILREAGKTAEMFRASLLPNDRWEIELVFSEEENGKKLSVEVVAFDKAGNSGEASIAAITLIIDIRPPVITDTWIQRTPIKTTVLEPYYDLKELETTDPNGERSVNVNRYQNGWFHIYAKVSEKETRIENVELRIYDTREPDTPLLTPQREGTLYAPYWLIKEEDILQAGERKWPNYTSNYDRGGRDDRYYYRVDIVAYDRAENGTDEIEIVEDQDHFCMWIKGDEPKGILDPVLGTVVPKGTPLPVQLFDDDSLEWAYTDLFTEDQWNNASYIGRKGSGTIDEQKLNWLKDQLVDQNALIDNWRIDKGYDSKKIEDLIGSKSIDEKWAYVETGNSENDYGEYILFSLVKDKKLVPHTGVGPRKTNEDLWKGRFWRISVIDDNLPTIVFDTVDTTPGSGYDPSKHPGNDPIEAAKTGNSPEENTFPKLTSDPLNTSEGGRYFTINGYTLRENRNEFNKVVKFRMAWIPYGMPGGADSHVNAVRDALRRGSGYPEGVQYWHFVDADATPAPGEIKLIDGTPEEIGKAPYRKQVFRKTFDILGGPDDIKPEWNNFNYNGERENEAKLFVFYAEDNLGEQHSVFRTVRFLGNKTPPGLTVYDISNVSGLDSIAPPILADYDTSAKGGNNNGTIEAAERTRYENDLKTYQATAYTIMRTLGMAASTEAPPYQTYTRGTTLKYWVRAERSGDLAVNAITMDDITYLPGKLNVGSNFISTDRALSYCETLPEVTQRVFLFTATDTLGNKAQIQRTVAVTNQAFLVDISTTEQTGKYGIDKKITLRANFSGQIEYTAGPGGSRPQLNVRYPTGATGATYGYASLNTTTPPDTSVLSLEFDFVVPVNANGRLETLYLGSFGTGDTRDRPIRLNGARILDAVRKDDAFTPRNSTGMGEWTTPERSLQEKKTITLDGIRPSIIARTVTGKAPYQSSASYYFKNGETLNLTLTADESIKPSGTPRLQYSIRGVDGSTVGTYNAAFTYVRPDGNTKMVFSLPVNATNLPSDGELINVSLYTGAGAGSIVDDVDNAVVANTVTNLIPTGTRIYIKKTPPLAPAASINNIAIPTGINYYNGQPTLSIPESSNKGPPNPGDHFWEDRREYSLNGGQIWAVFPTEVNGDWVTASGQNLNIKSGIWNLTTRYVDRAGNEGAQSSQSIQVNATFPRLISITADQSNGTYKQGDRLDFDLNFAEDVRIANAANVRITLRDMVTTTHNTGGTNPSYEIELTATGQTTLNSSIRFSWTPLNGKEMPNGLRVSNLVITGLQDQFGNNGINPTIAAASPFTITFPGSITCDNLNGSGLKVDCIAPRVDTRIPAIGSVMAGNYNQTITLTFNENVMKGNGTITVQPHGAYAIPPVLEVNGYYLDTNTGNRYSSPPSTVGVITTWVAGFYDIYNALNTSNRSYLTAGSSMSNLTLDTRTGQSAGPYMLITHGLKDGPGYTGNYTDANPGANGPNPDASQTYLVPDTTSKWVLDYKYSIDNNNNTQWQPYTPANAALTNADNTVVPSIRNALTAAKWRWQEMDVVSSTNVSGNTVTITLNEPLLKGLQWVVSYTAGTFTDMAGNSAPALSDNSYWFWSNGVQAPVIRVNRKSYDARNSNWEAATGRAYTPPNNTGGPGGWGIGDFNTVHYRIESETPGATIYYRTEEGNVTNRGSITADWTGNVPGTTVAWNITDSNRGTWVLPNLIRRSGSNTAGNNTYNVMDNGVSITRTISGTNYQGFRSHNRDILKSDLVNPAVNTQFTGFQGSFTYNALQASKNYVVAEARITNGGTPYTSTKSYEGVFRSVVALNQGSFGGSLGGANRDNNPIMIQGSNLKNGMPSIAGFPVRDAEETGDNRFVKLYYYAQIGGAANAMTSGQLYWVSTEIVSQWFELNCGRRRTDNQGTGGTHQSDGDVNNYLFAGYGDLTYSYNQR